SLAKGRLTIAALCVGMAERIVAEATAYALDNRQGGTPIGEFQLVQELLAESETEARAGRALVLETARAYDAGTDTRQGPAVGKPVGCGEGKRGGGPRCQGAGGKGLHAGRGGRALLPRSPPLPDLRGDRRDPEAGDRPPDAGGGESPSGGLMGLVEGRTAVV